MGFRILSSVFALDACSPLVEALFGHEISYLKIEASPFQPSPPLFILKGVN